MQKTQYAEKQAAIFEHRLSFHDMEEETMSEKKGSSRIGFFGEINHYDEHGKKIGESRPSFFGGFNEYDASGKKSEKVVPACLEE